MRRSDSSTRILATSLACLSLLVGLLQGCPGTWKGDHTDAVAPSRHSQSVAKAGGNQPVSAVVDHVYDGDNVWLLIEGERLKCRLIGIDTPEIRRGYRATQQARRLRTSEDRVIELGHIAAGRLRRLLPRGQRVGVVFDRRQQDKFGRELVYLYVAQGSASVNELLLREGLGWRYNDHVNTHYGAAFDKAERDARLERRGVWAPQ